MIHIFCWLLVILLLEARGLVSFQLSLLVMGLYLLAIYLILRGAASPAPVKFKKYICITDSNKLSTIDVESPEAVDVPLLDSSADQPPAQISEQQVNECILSIQSTGSSTESKVPHVRFTEEPDEDTSSEAESTGTSSKRSRHVDFAPRDDVRFFFSSDPPKLVASPTACFLNSRRPYPSRAHSSSSVLKMRNISKPTLPTLSIPNLPNPLNLPPFSPLSDRLSSFSSSVNQKTHKLADGIQDSLQRTFSASSIRLEESVSAISSLSPSLSRSSSLRSLSLPHPNQAVKMAPPMVRKTSQPYMRGMGSIKRMSFHG